MDRNQKEAKRSHTRSSLRATPESVSRVPVGGAWTMECLLEARHRAPSAVWAALESKSGKSPSSMQQCTLAPLAYREAILQLSRNLMAKWLKGQTSLRLQISKRAKVRSKRSWFALMHARLSKWESSKLRISWLSLLISYWQVALSKVRSWKNGLDQSRASMPENLQPTLRVAHTNVQLTKRLLRKGRLHSVQENQ